MTLIKILLITSFLSVLVWAFRNRNRAGMRASARVAALLLASFAITSVLNPGITQAAADAVGVTRGTDLILYALVLAFVVSTTGLYFRTRELERQIGALIRMSAVREAVLELEPRPPLKTTASGIEGSSG